MGTIVNLEEFAELVGVTGETMRAHIKAVEGDPDWLVDRGARGRGYKIEAEGALVWWQGKREADDLADNERKAALQQLRLGLVGESAEDPAQLTLSGRQRREEYAAGLDAIKYRKAMGELVEKAGVERVLSAAAVDLRRRMMLLPGEFVIAQGLEAHHRSALEQLIERALDSFVSAVEKFDAVD